MNLDQSAVEDLFERSADMRLLEFRNVEPGKAVAANRRTTASGFGAESIVPGSIAVVVDDAPRMRVVVAAAPSSGIIAGALVGIAIDVFNDGTAPAPESKLQLSLPLETEYRRGTLRIDGREPESPEALFAHGLPVACLPGATSSKITFTIHVLAGLNPLYFQPRLQTAGVPVVGTAGLSLKRAGPTGGTAVAPERPFYELDADETAAVAAETVEPVLPPVLPPELPPVLPLTATAAPAAVTAVPAKPATASAPRPETRMIRYRTIGPGDLVLLDRLFNAPAPGVIAHSLLISSIACTEQKSGADAGGYAAFLRGDIESLGRALVHARMGKPLQYRITQADLDLLRLPWQPSRAPAGRAQRRLRRDLRRPEWDALGGLMQPSDRDATVRARIALLALAAGTLEGVERSLADMCAAALAEYRALALAWLVPLSAASAGNDAYAIAAPAAAVDAAGRNLIAALGLALATL